MGMELMWSCDHFTLWQREGRCCGAECASVARVGCRVGGRVGLWHEALGEQVIVEEVEYVSAGPSGLVRGFPGVHFL